MSPSMNVKVSISFSRQTPAKWTSTITQTTQTSTLTWQRYIPNGRSDALGVLRVTRDRTPRGDHVRRTCLGLREVIGGRNDDLLTVVEFERQRGRWVADGRAVDGIAVVRQPAPVDAWGRRVLADEVANVDTCHHLVHRRRTFDVVVVCHLVNGHGEEFLRTASTSTLEHG